jgi:hypothetical protein
MSRLGRLAHDESVNAALGWGALGVAALAAGWSAFAGRFLWSGFAVFFVAVAAFPALTVRDRTALVPWPLLVVGAAALALRALDPRAEVAGSLAVAALALVGVVELDAFSPVDMSRRFAVGFTVLATLAVQALWSVAQFYSDRWLGTAFLRSQTELQWDIVVVTAVGFLLGGLSLLYFEWLGHVGSRAEPIVLEDSS